eukprot:19435-Heterococcus_DN1.PRE.1
MSRPYTEQNASPCAPLANVAMHIAARITRRAAICAHEKHGSKATSAHLCHSIGSALAIRVLGRKCKEIDAACVETSGSGRTTLLLLCAASMLSTGCRSLRLLSPCRRALASKSSGFSNDKLVTWSMHEQHDGVASLVLNNPAKLNALTVEMGTDFTAAISELAAACEKSFALSNVLALLMSIICTRQCFIHGQVRAVVLSGAGKAFSAGGDTAWLMRRHDDAPETNSRIMMKFYKSYLCLRTLPVPLIAAINGPAIGAGLCLAMACDIRITSLSAKLGLTFVTLGIHPGMASSHFLPQLIGPQAAKKMLLTGETITGS